MLQKRSFGLSVICASLFTLAVGVPSLGLADTLGKVKARGTLLVCHWPEYFGISFEHPRTRELQGLDIDMSKAFAKDLGVRLEYVKTNFASFMDRLEAGDCDIAMMGSGITPARQQRVDFSDPYLRSDIYFITTKSNKMLQTVEDLDQPGIVIAVQKGTYMEPFSRNYFKNASLSIVDKPSEREIEVETGRADAFATDYPYSQRMLRNVDWARLISPTKELKMTDYAYAVRKGDPQWLATVNEFVANAKKDGRLETAARANNLLPILVKE